MGRKWMLYWKRRLEKSLSSRIEDELKMQRRFKQGSKTWQKRGERIASLNRQRDEVRNEIKRLEAAN